MRSESSQKPVSSSCTSDAEDPDQPNPCYQGKAVVLCLGNKYRKDDGVGLRVAQALGALPLGTGVFVEACQGVELSLLSRFQGAGRIVVVDAVKSGSEPGTVSCHQIALSERPLFSLPGIHAMQVHDAFDVARQTGLLTCPVTIIGIEPKDCGVGEELSPEVQDALPVLIRQVISKLS